MRQILLEIPVHVAVYVVMAFGALLIVVAFLFKAKDLYRLGGGVLLLTMVARTGFWERLATWHPLPVFGFGMMLCLALLSSSWLFQWLTRREGLDVDRVMDLGMWIFISGLIGARLLFMVRNPDEFHSPLDFFKIWQGGIVFYGGVIAALAVFIWYTRRHQLPALRVLDVFAPAAALGIGVGRIGCLLNGCCWGKPSTLPWAISFPAESIPWQAQAHQELINADAIRSLTVHPTQIYLAISGWLLLALTLWFYPRRRHYGEVMVMLMLGYSISRFAVEFFRGDEPLWPDRLTISQNISIVIFAGALYFWGRLRHQPGITAAVPAKV